LDEITDAIKLVPGFGMPSARYHNPGDLILKLNVVFPDSIAPESCQALQALLPPPRPLPTWGDNVLVDEVTMVDASEARTKSRSRGDEMDEDDESGGGGQPHVQWYVLNCPSLSIVLGFQTDA
jgi:DnaJ family protein A protein 2